jgi:triacylglycerol lipase
MATPGVKWMTIRSNNNDKYAQPDGIWIGAPGTATNVTYAGPALKGATNVVLDARDHHEVSFHPEAFVPAYRFITGRDPANPSITPESSVVLDGIVTGTGPGGPTNLPLESAMVEVYATDANTGERRGVPLRTVTVGVDGRWGPLTVDPGSPLEFVVTAAGYAVHHVYRSPFPRSSSIVHLRPEKLLDSDRSAASVVTFVRPRGYFGLPRDQIVFDNRNPAPGIPTGVAGVASSRMALSSADRVTVVGDYKSGVISERVVGRTWPVANNQLSTLELHF